jgi:hypothetical protein
MTVTNIEPTATVLLRLRQKLILRIKMLNDLIFMSPPLCYNPKCSTSVKYELGHVYINSWTPFPCKPVFKGE